MQAKRIKLDLSWVGDIAEVVPATETIVPTVLLV